MTDLDELVDVHVLQLPVALWARAQEHSDALMREFALIAADAHDGDGADVPARLLQLVEALSGRYSGVTGEQEAMLARAAEERRRELDLHYRVPASAAAAAEQLEAMLEEADEYCRAGQHLLTLETPADQVLFRRWFLDEFVQQAQGRPPVPWPQYRDRAAAPGPRP